MFWGLTLLNWAWSCGSLLTQQNPKGRSLSAVPLRWRVSSLPLPRFVFAPVRRDEPVFRFGATVVIFGTKSPPCGGPGSQVRVVLPTENRNRSWRR